MRQGHYALFVGALAVASPLATCNVVLAQATKITIIVLNEENRGVKSVIAVKREGKKARFGETDHDGRIQRMHRCQLGETFQADPQDRGPYFSSEERDCGEQVTLRVIGRRTPYGAALDASTEPVEHDFGDAWKYVVVSKGFSQDKLNPTPGGPSGERCELLVEAKVIPELYAVDKNAKWMKVPHFAEIRTSEAKFVYNRPCAQVDAKETRAKALEAASTQIQNADFSKDVRIKEAIADFQIKR